MRMYQRRVAVPVNVRLATVPSRFVRMLVVGIVRVLMLVFHRLVLVRVLVALGYVQPYAERHQRAGDPERQVRVLPQKR